MKRLRRILAAGLAAAALSTAVRASSPQADYAIDWYTIDGGGGSSSSGVFTLSGTIGQTDAGSMASGSYSLDGGFWAATPKYSIYLPLIRR